MNRCVVFASLFLLLVSASAKDITQQLLIKTAEGTLKGSVEDNVCIWRGVKYAEAERFGYPHPPAPWIGTKEAFEFGPVAPQVKGTLSSKEEQSEDCLYLNIWSPAMDGKKRPVMVWIHGGSFVMGSGSSPMYDGLELARTGDVVVVSINYRLGILGFLYFKNATATGDTFGKNLGMHDQIAALRWIKQNISAFGGDPSQVTIFGESAGGTSVLTLLSSPLTKGLIKNAIAQSPTPSVIWQPGLADSITQKYLSFLGISRDSIHLLKKLPLEELIKAQKELLKYMLTTTSKVFAPTVDGIILKADIFESAEEKINSNIPLMIGTNLDESSLFVKKLKMAPRNAKQLDRYFDEIHTINKQNIFEGYDNYPRRRAVFDILSDAAFRIPGIRLSEKRITAGPVYMYRFEYCNFTLKLLGVRCFHGLEIPFVFGNVNKKMSRVIRGWGNQKAIKNLSAEMQTSWVNFAKYSNPNGKSEVVWKPYELYERPTMIFNRKCRLQNDPDAKQRIAWTKVIYY